MFPSQHNVSSKTRLDLANSQVVLTRSDGERFWAKVDRRGPDDCWPWLASKSGGAGEWYGQFGFGSRRRRRVEGAHRVAWILTHGRILGGQHVLHSCDDPGCCNPAHLFLGDQTDNMRDASKKGRLSNPRKRNRANRALVVERYLAGASARVLAAECGVHYMTVLRWVRGSLGDLRAIWRGIRKPARSQQSLQASAFVAQPALGQSDTPAGQSEAPRER